MPRGGVLHVPMSPALPWIFRQTLGPLLRSHARASVHAPPSATVPTRIPRHASESPSCVQVVPALSYAATQRANASALTRALPSATSLTLSLCATNDASQLSRAPIMPA